jgi:hypothetical protein
MKATHNVHPPEGKDLEVARKAAVHCRNCSSSLSAVIPSPAVYRQQFIDWIMRHNISFEAAVAEDTRELFFLPHTLSASLPALKTTVSTWIHESLKVRKQILVNTILSAKSKINLTFDGWKAPNHLNFIAVCAHFIDHELQHHHLLIGLRRIIGRKSGDNEAEVIFKNIDEYAIGSSNIGACSSDNASDNNVAVRTIGQ